MEDFLSISEVAKKLNLSQKTIRRHIASGKITAYQIGNVYRIKEKDINSYLKKNATSSRKYEQLTLFNEPKTIPKRRKSKDFVHWVNIGDLWEKPKKTKLTFVDLFSGAGGISKGFEMAGINGIYGLDIFDAAVQTYKNNFSHPICEGDITDKSVKKDFVKKVKGRLKGRKLNIIAGGFPCQGFSLSGHRIVADPRNNLYLDMLEVVKALKPEFVVMENVVGLRSMLKGGVERRIIQDYIKIGYEINVTTLCAADYEVPQKRNRVIFIANRIGLKNHHPEPLLAENEYKTTKDAIQDLVDQPDDKKKNHIRTKHSDDMSSRISKVPEGKSLYENYSDSWKKCPWNEPSCTIKENHGGVNLHPKRGRVLTAREMARIQSFPDDFIFSGTKSKQLVQIGNAVPPLLAKAIGLSVIKTYKIKT